MWDCKTSYFVTQISCDRNVVSYQANERADQRNIYEDDYGLGFLVDVIWTEDVAELSYMYSEDIQLC